MKFCQSHWDKLKAAIADRGLDKFIAKNGEEAAKLLAEGRPDPLLSAHNAIVSNALGAIGLDLMVPNEDGSERCPICFLKAISSRVEDCGCGRPDCTPEKRAADFEGWIDRAASDELERFSGKATA